MPGHLERVRGGHSQAGGSAGLLRAPAGHPGLPGQRRDQVGQLESQAGRRGRGRIRDPGHEQPAGHRERRRRRGQENNHLSGLSAIAFSHTT